MGAFAWRAGLLADGLQPGHVFGDFNVRGSGFFGLRELECLAEGFGNDLGYRQARVPLRHRFGRASRRPDAGFHFFLVHPVMGGLAGERDEWRPVHIGIRHPGDEIRGARPQRGETNPRLAGQPAVHVRHEGRALLVAGGDKTDRRAEEGVEQIHVLLARHTKNVLDPFVLQAFNDEFSGFRFLLSHAGYTLLMSQMSRAYSATVRSLENFPIRATFRTAMRAHAAG